jgi:hypothetical protein
LWAARLSITTMALTGRSGTRTCSTMPGRGPRRSRP